MRTPRLFALTFLVHVFSSHTMLSASTLELQNIDYVTAQGKSVRGIPPGGSGEMHFLLKNSSSAPLANLKLKARAGECVESVSGELTQAKVAREEEFRIGPIEITLTKNCSPLDPARLLLVGSYQDSLAQTNRTWIDIPFMVLGPPFIKYSQTNMGFVIPDSGKIELPFTIAQSFLIGDISVTVDITHPYIGDLTIELHHEASWTGAFLHSRTGGSTDDIKRTYGKGGTPKPDLNKFIGLPAKGNWKLIIADHNTRDIGKINSFSVTLYPVK